MKYSFSISFFFLLAFILQAQNSDSLDVFTMGNKLQPIDIQEDSIRLGPCHPTFLGVGFFVGSDGFILYGKSGELLQNRNGFSFGVEAEFAQIFSKIHFNYANGNVKKDFSYSNFWPEKLPLDLTSYFFALGYKIKFLNEYSINPMVHYIILDYQTDERVKEFTNIDCRIGLQYAGISVGLSWNIGNFIDRHIFIEMVGGFSKPINSAQREVFPGTVMNISVGLLYNIWEKHYL